MFPGSMNLGFGMKCSSLPCAFRMLAFCKLKTSSLSFHGQSTFASQEPQAMRTHAHNHSVLHLSLAFFPLSLHQEYHLCQTHPVSGLRRPLGRKPSLAPRPTESGVRVPPLPGYIVLSLPPLCTWVGAQFNPGTDLHVAFTRALNACSIIV